MLGLAATRLVGFTVLMAALLGTTRPASANTDCLFTYMDTTEICTSYDGGRTVCTTTDYYAWVCSSTGGEVGPISGSPCKVLRCWGNTPPPGTVGPPAPPPPPPTDCQICQARCFDNYVRALEPVEESWFGSCGLFCQRFAGLELEACLGGCLTDFTAGCET